MFWWIEPVLLTITVLFILSGVFCALLIAIDYKNEIIKFFIGLWFKLIPLFYILFVVVIIYEIWIKYLPA